MRVDQVGDAPEVRPELHRPGSVADNLLVNARQSAQRERASNSRQRSREMTPAPEPRDTSSLATPIPPTADAVLIMDAAVVAETLRRMARAIIEHHPEWSSEPATDGSASAGLAGLVLVGIQSRGVEVARRLAVELGALLGNAGDDNAAPTVGSVDVSMHRDDLRRLRRPPAMQVTDLPLDLDDMEVILTDDVFFTGRTVRAALDALGDFGRPRRVQLAALVERAGHRELPIRPDYVGESLDSAYGDRIRVRFQSIDGEPDAVWLLR